MFGALITPSSAVRGIVATVVLLVVAIILVNILGGLGFLGLVTWTLLLAGIAVGLFLIVRAGQPIAGAGTILMPLAAWTAFFVQPPAFVWTGLFFIGAILIAWGTSADTPLKQSWPILMVRVVVGWAWVDNAQDHFITNWLPGGGGFLQGATTNANRPPLYLLDPLYQEFLKNVVVPGGDKWAALTICGELSFGLLLAMGLFTPIATIGLLWHSANYMLQRGFVPHGGYSDKTFFTVDLFLLIVLAGLAYGLDATLRRYVPSAVAKNLMGLSGAEAERVPVRAREPQPV